MENIREILTKEEFDELLALPQDVLAKISQKIEEKIVSTEKNMERKFQTQLRKQQSSFGFKIYYIISSTVIVVTRTIHWKKLNPLIRSILSKIA